jgi:hypothetical protein
MTKLSGVLVARMLAERLASIVPPPFRVSALDGVVRFENPEVAWIAESFVAALLREDDDNRESVVTAAWNALSAAQDYISEVTREPWPARSVSGAGHGPIPLPYAAVGSEVLRLGFTVNDVVGLEMPGIRLTDLAGS